MAGLERKTHVIASSAEKGPIIQKLEQIPGVELEFAELAVGDYLLDHGLVVERKSATDFILSVVDKRLPDEVGKLTAEHARPVYVIEGDLYEPRFHQKAFDVHLALSWMSVLHGIPVLPSRDAESSAVLVYAMAADAQHRLGQPASHRAGDPKARGEAQRYLVEGLPGVDAGGAEALLERFGTPAAVFAASVENLVAAGLEEKAAQRIRRTLDSTWYG